jgi:energy-coupling factor transporter ATP-binding protein EcfA2
LLAAVETGLKEKMKSIARAVEVAYRYPQNDQGLAPFSLDVKAGDTVLVTGPSGCGKSTLARCLSGLIPHLYHGELTGEVQLDGLRTSETPLWRLTEQAGLVFQNSAAQMLTTSVEEEIVFGLENLGLPPRDIHDRLEAALARFGLEVLRHRSPQTLSGGEQQKLALAAVTARCPPLLVLDEPLSMLDGAAVADLVEHLSDLTHSGTSAVVCEHRAEYLKTVPGLRTIHLNSHAAPAPIEDPNHAPRQATEGCPHHVSDFTLEVAQLSVTLGKRPILRDLSFSAAGGSVVAVVGRNGVGKTTLLRALVGPQAHTGTITIGGESPDLGMVFQNPDLHIFNPTVRQEILHRVVEPDMALYKWALRALGLEQYENTPPLLLSEGEKKRVALATVLVRKPRHGILLDEPSLGQDEAHKTMLIHLCRALADAGQLVILTTHDLTLAAQANRLLLLGTEGFVADGPPADVLRDHTAWARLGLRVPAWLALPQKEIQPT